MTLLSSGAHNANVGAIGWSLLEFLWQGGLLALALAVILKIVKAESASRRYIACCVALAAMVSCPAVTYAFLTLHPVATAVIAHGTGNGISMMASVSDASRNILAGSISRLFALMNPHMGMLVAVWAIGVLLMLGRVLFGVLEMARLRKSSTSAVPAELASRTQELAARVGLKRAVHVRTSGAVQAPVVVGCIRPVILLSANPDTCMSSEQWQPVLAHEVAHVHRHDPFVNAVQVVLEALFFFHPGVWWVSRQMRREREHCCDDIAVAMSGSTLIYIKALATLEEQRSPAKLQLSLSASGGHLTMRIKRLITKDPLQRSSNVPRIIAAVLAAGAATCLLTASLSTTRFVSAQTVQPTPVNHEQDAVASKPSAAPDLNCSFYAKGDVVEHPGLCEAAADGNSYACRQIDGAMNAQEQSSCEWKVLLHQEWERSHASSKPQPEKGGQAQYQKLTDEYLKLKPEYSSK